MVAGVANALRPFRVLQVGKESTYGTEVAATRVIKINDMRFNDQAAQRSYLADASIGRMSKHSEAPIITRTGATGMLDMDLTFEDVLLPLLTGMQGGVTASAEKTVGMNDREWIFQLDPNTGDPTPEALTLERRLSNGSTNWDRTVTGAICSGFEISASQDDDVTKLTMDWWGRAPNNNAITGALSAPTTQKIPALSWKVYVDDTWAAMDQLGAAPSYGGGAQWSTTIRAFRWTYDGGLRPALYIGDGRTDPSKHRFGRRGVELELEVEINDNILHTSTGELAAAAAGSKRYVRLLGEGTRCGASGYYHTILLQGAFVYPDGGFGEIGSSSDDAETMTLRLETIADDDTNDTEVRIINQLSSYP